MRELIDSFYKERRIELETKFPNGCTSCWQNKHLLVCSKFAELLSSGQTESDWQALLIKSDGINRENDDFIEAHIYEGFDKNAIESMVQNERKKKKKIDDLDFRTSVFLFEQMQEKTK